MIEIDLKVLWLSDEQQQLDDAGMDIDFDKCFTKIHTFYSISFLRPLEEKGYCQIGSNGEEYVIRESYESVKHKIKAQIIFKWN